MTKQIKKSRGTKQVAVARREELKKLISDKGLTNMPTHSVLGKQFNVSISQIAEDMKLIISTFDPYELDVVFTEFFNVQKKALDELRGIINTGTIDQRIKAISSLHSLSKTMIDTLEAYAKKAKVSDKVEIDTRNYNINITDTQDNIIDITPKKISSDEDE